MHYHELEAAVEQLDGELAAIRHRADPSREFLAEIEYCQQRDGLGYVYLFWVDRRTLSAYAETLTRVRGEDLISVQRSGIPLANLSAAYLADDWRTTLRDPEVFPEWPANAAEDDPS